MVPLLERLEFKSLLEQIAEGANYRAAKEFSLEDGVSGTERGRRHPDFNQQDRGPGEMAFDFHLDDYKYPVSARVDSFLIALNEREIYSLPFTENCLQLFNAVFSNAGIKNISSMGKRVSSS